MSAKRDSIITKAGAKLIEVETAQEGKVLWSVYMNYLRACGIGTALLTFLGYCISYSFNLGSSLWLSEWSNDSQDPVAAVDPAKRDLRLGVYAALGFSETIFILLTSITLNLSAIRGSQMLHNDMLVQVLHAPMTFFDTTPLGRILNRFSKDIDTMDVTIVHNLRHFILNLFKTIVAFIIISLENPVFLAAVLPLAVAYYFLQKLYISTSRQLKRLESITRSPIYTHFSETVSGVSTIRAFGAAEKFLLESNHRVDINTSCYYPSIVATRWLGVRLEFLGYCIVFLAALFAALTKGSLAPGLAALSITTALTITSNLNMLVKASADVETNIVAVERALEYTSIESEAPWHIDSTKPDETWPPQGAVNFDHYSTRYRKGLPLVLEDLSVNIKPGEKVGIVGRTGAGKSSFTLGLFRLIEAAGGKIIIDNLDISKLGLHDLRSKLTIIPQDPVLFTGPLRINLDPFGRYPDSELWQALELSHLKDFVKTLALGLDHLVTEGGDNLSVGQRQLICLARALLRKSRILVLDEATAAVDMETDDLIQSTIRDQFNDCTILTIAHRLNTIMDYDRILVLDKGRVVEFESPNTLLQIEGGIFQSMAKDAGLI